jgi:hypothetical protein
VVLVIWVVVILCFIIWVWLGLALIDLGIGFCSFLIFKGSLFLSLSFSQFLK